jgi:hypothetical protein
MTAFEGRWSVVFARKSILYAKVGEKSMGSKFYVEAGTVADHRAKSISESLVSALVRTVSSYRTNCIAKTFKKCTNFGIVV